MDKGGSTQWSVVSPSAEPWQRVLLILGPYLVFGVLWILFSDALLLRLAPDPEAFVRGSTYKGWVFVVGTTVLLAIPLLARERASIRNRSQLFELITTVQSLARAHDEGTLFATACTSARRLTGADGAGVILCEGKECHHCAEDAVTPAFKGRRIPMERCISGIAMAQRHSLVIRNTLHDPRIHQPDYASSFVRALAVTPMGRTHSAGAINVYWARPHRIKRRELVLLETLAEATAIALENLRVVNELEVRVADRTRALHAAMDRAQAADRLKSVFLATMSHELRTPLNSILGFTGVLLKGLAGPLNEEQARQLGMVREGGRHLLALITDILDISKIEAGQLQIEHKPFNPCAALREVHAALLPAAETKGLALTCDCAPDLSEPIMGDDRRFRQVLYNLIGNAIKFTAQGNIGVSLQSQSGELLATVTDTGPGIPPELHDRLFEPFQQLDAGLGRSQEGTGLGLAVSARLAALMGGRIAFASQPGVGSTFCLHLPLSRP